jgi:preprotein translocase subunit SecG
MEALKIIIIVLECIASVVLIASVLLQSGKEAGLGALAGKNDTYLSKSKAGSLDKILATATKWVALVWALLTLSLSML